MKLYFAGAETWENLFQACGVRRRLASFYYGKGMKYYFAGSEYGTPSKVISNFSNCSRLQSFHYLKGTKISPWHGDLLLDSGGFTARTKGVKISVEEFAEFINKNNISKAFNLDTNDISETLLNQEYLIKNCPNCYIIPIYHFSDFFEKRDLINQFLNFPYIAIGGLVGIKGRDQEKKQFLDFVFNKTKNEIRVHGLGVSGKKLLNMYPFYSVDSTSWVAPSKFGSSSTVEDKRVLKIRNTQRSIEYRLNDEIKYFLQLEKQITNIWKARGVEWTEFQK